MIRVQLERTLKCLACLEKTSGGDTRQAAAVVGVIRTLGRRDAEFRPSIRGRLLNASATSNSRTGNPIRQCSPSAEIAQPATMLK